MYKVALIQNESEMMRYSWADIRPMLSMLDYAFDGYTSEDIEDLYNRLSSDCYDAIIIASNACNDEAVRESLVKHKEAISSFLNRGKGLFVSFQMKLAEYKYYDFMPDPFKVSAKNRIYTGESPKDGKLVVGDGQNKHTILYYPNKVDLTRVKHRCLNNNLVEGLYWIHLTAEHAENYESIIEDTSYAPARQLLIASRADLAPRVVISALALDWQMHTELWKNVIRYVVENRPSIAIINKAGNSPFDFRYLVSINISKLPYAEYVQESINPKEISLDVHDTYILDPAWSDQEVESFVRACSSLIESGKARVFYFDKCGQGLPTLRAVSNVREYQIIARNAITWLISQFPDSEDQGYWAGSFWCTVDALATLTNYNVSTIQFKDKVLKTIEKHDRNGSYDEVLGATCAMLETYAVFLGLKHSRTKRAMEWIQSCVDGKTLFERATAYDVLCRLKIDVPAVKLSDYKNEVMANLNTLDNEFVIYRHARTLLTCGFLENAEQVVLKLEGLQNQRDGKWVNIPNTAALVELLIDIQNATKSPSPQIDEMIFRGVKYLRTTYTQAQFSWKGDVSATAKALRALRAFEQRITLPIDVIATAIQAGEARARNYIAIEVATARNVRLQNQVNDLANRGHKLQQRVKIQRARGAFAVRLSVLLIIMVSIILSMTILFISYLVNNSLLAKAWSCVLSFMSQSIVGILASLALIPVALVIIVLRKLKRLPKWLSSILSPFVTVDE